MNPTIVKATSLPDAWFQLVYVLMTGQAPHSVYEIDKGSYVGQKRLEFDYAMVMIDHPGSRPLIPDIPPGLGIPAPVEDMEYVEDYFANYLMNPEIEDNETYKYATWLAPGVERVIEQLHGAPGNNQAAISIGGWAPDAEFASVVGPKTTEEGYAPRQGDGLFIGTVAEDCQHRLPLPVSGNTLHPCCRPVHVAEVRRTVCIARLRCKLRRGVEYPSDPAGQAASRPEIQFVDFPVCSEVAFMDFGGQSIHRGDGRQCQEELEQEP